MSTAGRVLPHQMQWGPPNIGKILGALTKYNVSRDQPILFLVG